MISMIWQHFLRFQNKNVACLLLILRFYNFLKIFLNIYKTTEKHPEPKSINLVDLKNSLNLLKY